MLDHDQLIPEETEASYEPLIEDLRRAYTTPAEDQASLARIRAQLLQKSDVSALPARTPAARVISITPAPTLTDRRPRRPYLTALAAALLLVVLIGSFTLIFHPLQRATAVPAATPAVAPGWSLVARFSGTGP